MATFLKAAKYFLYKLRQDANLLRGYPVASLVWHESVDYDDYWAKRGRGGVAKLSSWQKQRADYILQMIEPGSRVLDLGCGDGALLKYLGDRAKIEGVGVDFSEKVLELARQLGVKTLRVDLSDLANLQTLPEADYILGLELIEHLANSEEFIKKLKSKAKKALIFSFPNTGYYPYRLRLLLGSFLVQWITHPGEHLRFWTVKDVKWWVKALGFNLDKLIVYEGLPILNRIWPKLFGQGIIIKIS